MQRCVQSAAAGEQHWRGVRCCATEAVAPKPCAACNQPRSGPHAELLLRPSGWLQRVQVGNAGRAAAAQPPQLGSPFVQAQPWRAHLADFQHVRGPLENELCPRSIATHGCRPGGPCTRAPGGGDGRARHRGEVFLIHGPARSDSLWIYEHGNTGVGLTGSGSAARCPLLVQPSVWTRQQGAWRPRIPWLQPRRHPPARR